MAIINEDRLQGRLLEVSKGRVVLLCLAMLGIGVALGALLF